MLLSRSSKKYSVVILTFCLKAKQQIRSPLREFQRGSIRLRTNQEATEHTKPVDKARDEAVSKPIADGVYANRRA